MEELQAFFDVFESQGTIPLKDELGSLLVELFRPRFHDRQEFENLVMLRIDGMSRPEHVITFFDLVDGPKELALKDHDFDIVRVPLQASVDLCERQLLISSANVRKCPNE